MTIAGFESGKSLSVGVHDPLVKGGAHLYDIAETLSAYAHEKTAEEGYKSVNIGLSGQQVDLEEWQERGLGRHLLVYDPGLKQIHEVFVNRMMINLGSLTVERGPLMEVANRIALVYTPVLDYNVDPPVLGTPQETTLAEDTDSQDKYGILEQILPSGNLINDGTINEADELRDTYLNEKREPITNQSVSTGGSREASATLECLGYGAWFEKWVYNSYSTGYSTLNTKLQAVLATDPNSIFSTDYNNWSTNALLTSTSDDKNRTAATIIKEIIAQGDVNNNRWFFTIGAGRKITYGAIPTTIEYFHLITENSQSIIDINENVIEPWDIEAGKWLAFTDTLIGRAVDTDLMLDPRVMFVESVRYTAPYQFQLAGAKQGLVKQRLAKLGLTG